MLQSDRVTPAGEYSIIAGRINDLAWDGDSQRIIAVGDGRERFGHCITADSGNSCGEVAGHSSQINSVSIRQQRPLRAATGSDDTSMVFYHGAPFKFNTSSRGQHNKFIFGTAFSPDGGSLVTVGSDRKIWLYDGKTGEAQKQIGEGEHTGSIFGVSWAKDSKSFVTASADQTVKLWDAEVGKVTQSWRMGEDKVASIRDQQVGVVWPHGRSDGLIISVDLDGNLNYLTQGSPKPSKIVRGHQKNITAAGITSVSGAQTLWTGSSDGCVRSWDVQTGLASDVDGEGHSNYVSGFASSPTHMHSVGWDDTLRTIDSSAKTFTGTSGTKLSGQPKGVAVAHGNTYVATLSGIDILSPSDNTQITAVPVKGFTPTALAASPDGAILALGGDDKAVRIYDASTAPPRPTTELREALTSAVSTLAFSPTGAHLAVGTAGGLIVVYKTADWSVETKRWSAHTGRVTSIAWSRDGQAAASASLDTNVFVWSLSAPGRRVKAGNAHKDGVSGVVWVEGDGEARSVLSVGADASVKVWKVLK